MSNRLSMPKYNSIEVLHRSGHSNREISRLLGVDRGAVNQAVQRLKAANAQNRPNPHTGSDIETGGLPTLEIVARSGPKNQCEPYREQILSKLNQGLSAVRIHYDLKTEQGFSGSYHSVRRFLLSLGRKTPLPFRRMGTEPGEEAQIDFGMTAFEAVGRGSIPRWGILTRDQEFFEITIVRAFGKNSEFCDCCL